MVHIGYLKRIWLSVTDRNIGQTVISESLGVALKYFLVLILLVGVITMAVNSYSLYFDMKEAAQIVQRVAPDFRLENGTFICQGKMPIVKTYDGFVLFIDTTGKTSANVLDKYDQAAFIFSTKMISKKGLLDYSTLNFKDLTWLNFTKQDMIRFIRLWVTPIVFILGLIFFGVVQLMNLFLVSLIGLIVSAFMKFKLSFANIFKLSIYAITLSIVMKTILSIFDIDIPYFLVVGYVITVFYLYRYFSEIRKEELTLWAEKTEKLPEDIL